MKILRLFKNSSTNQPFGKTSLILTKLGGELHADQPVQLKY